MKILVILGNYLPKPRANGVCTHEVILELKKRGHQVDVLCFDYDSSSNSSGYKQVEENSRIYRVRAPILNYFTTTSRSDNHNLIWKICQILSIWITRMKTLLFIPFYPLNSIGLVYRYYNKFKIINKNEKYDTVITVYKPLEAVIAGALISKKYTDIKSIMYVLDTLTSINNKETLLDKWFKKSGWLWEKRLYKIYTSVINMKSYEDNYTKKRYDKYRGKLFIADIPLLTEASIIDKEIKSKSGKRKWIYCGTLNGQTRSPSYLCEMFSLDSHLSNDEIHFYSNGDCEDLIRKYAKTTNGKVQQHGYVTRTKILEEINDAAILVSIGNKSSSMVPSKIFEYMSTGKKIIHFYTSKNDSCITYLKKYKNALLIDENLDIEDNIMQVEHFLNRRLEKITQQDLDNLFKLNKPSYTVNIIEKSDVL